MQSLEAGAKVQLPQLIPSGAFPRKTKPLSFRVSLGSSFQEGKLEEFKRLAAQCLEIVRTKDTGTLQYDIYFNDDQSASRTTTKPGSSAAPAPSALLISRLHLEVSLRRWRRHERAVRSETSRPEGGSRHQTREVFNVGTSSSPARRRIGSPRLHRRCEGPR
jgi:hypothetical protein